MTYYYRVKAYNSGGDSAYSNTASATTLPGGGPVDDLATGEIFVAGIVSGDYTDTHSDDSACESILERESGGKPDNRYSYLEHKWIFNVTGGSTVTFNLNAYKDNSTDGDDFIFSYSTDDINYVEMLTVTKTSDDGEYQSFALPSSISGTVYIHVRDTDQTQGHRSLDAIHIDHMYIRSE